MSEQEQRGRGFRKVVYVVVALLAVFVVMYVWKELSVYLLSRTSSKEKAELAEQQGQREQALHDAFVEKTSDLIELLGTPLGWAVRNEALQEDYAQINEYAVRLVKEPAVQRVVFVTPDGNVKIATDKKLEGAPAATYYGELPKSEDITVSRVGDGLHLVVPILGYNARLGSLIVTFLPDAVEPPNPA